MEILKITIRSENQYENRTLTKSITFLEIIRRYKLGGSQSVEIHRHKCFVGFGKHWLQNFDNRFDFDLFKGSKKQSNARPIDGLERYRSSMSHIEIWLPRRFNQRDNFTWKRAKKSFQSQKQPAKETDFSKLSDV